jgi:hypothetical protein
MNQSRSRVEASWAHGAGGQRVAEQFVNEIIRFGVTPLVLPVSRYPVLRSVTHARSSPLHRVFLLGRQSFPRLFYDSLSSL